MAETEGVDLVYSNPAEVVVDKFFPYTADQVSKAVGQVIPAIKVPKGLRSILTTVVFKKKDGWTPARVSYHARRFKERGYPGEILETGQSYRYTLEILPEVTEQIKSFRYKVRTIKKGKDAGKKISLLFGIIPKVKVPAEVKVGQKLEPIRPANFRTPEAQYKTIRKGLIAKMKSKKITHITPKVAKKYKLYPEAKKFNIRVEQIPEEVIKEIKAMKNITTWADLEMPRPQREWVAYNITYKIEAPIIEASDKFVTVDFVFPFKKTEANFKKLNVNWRLFKRDGKYCIYAGDGFGWGDWELWDKEGNRIKPRGVALDGQVSARVPKAERIKRMWVGKIKGGKVKSLKKSFAEKYDLTTLARKHGIQVGQEVITRRKREVTQEIANFIRAKYKEGIKPNVIKGLIEDKFNVSLSTSTIYKVAKGLYKTSVVERQIGKEVNKMGKQKISDVLGGTEDAVVAEIMANPGLSGLFERCPKVAAFAKKLAHAGMTARQVTNRINDAITKAGKVGNISVNRLRNWGKKIGKPWLFSRYKGSEAEKKAKWSAAKATGFPRIRGKGGKSLGRKGYAGLAEIRKEVTAAGKAAAEKAIAAYKGRYPKEAIAARRAMAKAVAEEVAGSLDVGGYEGIAENPIALDLAGTGKDIFAKLIGILAGTNVTGLIKKGADALLKVETGEEGWKPAISKVGSGLVGYFVGDVLDRVVRPGGAYAAMVREIFESFRTGAVLYIGSAIPIPERMKVIHIASGVESYIDSVAEKALSSQTGAEMERISQDLIEIPSDTPEAVSQQVLPDGSTLIEITDSQEPVSAELEDIESPVEAELEEIGE